MKRYVWSDDENKRVIKREFLAMIAERTELPEDVVGKVVDACNDLIIEIVIAGGTVLMTGFGRFYGQLHRGHKVQFASGKAEIPDYMVLKFTATREVNRSIETRVLGTPDEPSTDPS